MIHSEPEAILPQTFNLLQLLQEDAFLMDFFLVGGTALALHIGHRLSIDLDFFSMQPFDNSKLEEHLLKKFGFSTDYIAVNTLKGFINNVKVDFLTHAYPLVRPLIKIQNLSLASLEDIGAMKLNAIAHSGNRQKDFFDLYFLLEHLSLQEILAAYRKKYANSNPIIPLKAITWFEDIDFELEKPMLKNKITFERVRKRLVQATEWPERIFPGQ
ncbi:MAG TPA: nucleotidyl transferase AbiEii/AbiGii toxin family protein [Flavilitoribacter sp.]|nr:nucleotidyl transferase AbiEii/AbiGii toxin family protein [Flavilitoribacter sp.]HMQ86402.1 nucleotidyl transferase AbiEii/AbiGii toxin family protein [Flavilitoribacter sp.]